MRSIFFLLITILFSNLSLFSQTEIHVESEPGVSVYLDTVFKGKTTKNDGGLIIKDVIEGVHTIEVKKEGHLPQTER